MRNVSSTCLAVIPARGGSKGIPKKNIQLVNGKPLVSIAIEKLIESEIDVDIAVSTDDEEICTVIEGYSDKIYIIKRPAEISTDSSKTEDALIHAINHMLLHYSRSYKSIMTVQPTSPLRSIQTIQAFKKYFDTINKTYDAMLTLTESYADYWIKKDGGYNRLFADEPRRRQDRTPIFIENSCLYITKVSSLIETNSVLGHHAYGFLINAIEAIDINERSDILFAEALLKLKNADESPPLF